MNGPCTSFAPGRALPQGECERCHFQRHEHLEEHRNTPGTKKPSPEPAVFQIFPKADPPKTVFCRNCGAGLIIQPPANQDSHPCPKCGHDGPKSGHPAIPMPDEKVQQRVAPSLAQNSGVKYVDFDEVP